MPFVRLPNGKYKSDSGKIYTYAQVKLYYATHGFKDKLKPKKKNT